MAKETKVIQGRTYVTSYSFDKNGNLAGITYPSGRTVAYAVDAADRTTGVTTTPAGGTAQTVASSISHKPFGGISSMTYGNALVRNVGYDQQYRITAIQTGAVQNLAYTLDANGNITGITDNLNPTKNKTFSYDALDRLTGGAGPWGTLNWTYDGVGNRQTQTENGATSTYSYQSGTNRISGVSGAQSFSFGFDSNGNTTTENAKTFTYNQNNRLIKASESATLGEYTFNANGQRAAKTASGSTTIYHHDQQGNIIAETDASGSTKAEYVWLGMEPLAKADSSGLYFIHADHLATPRAMTNSVGSKVWEIDAKPFGDGGSITGTATLDLRFPGQYFDSETGLHQNWFRDYMPKVGRYIEPDPIGIAVGPNLYDYGFFNPLGYVDSTGQSASVAVGGRIGGALGGALAGGRVGGVVGGVVGAAVGAAIGAGIGAITAPNKCEETWSCEFVGEGSEPLVTPGGWMKRCDYRCISSRGNTIYTSLYVSTLLACPDGSSVQPGG